MVVARLVYLLQPHHSAMGIPARWLAKGFVLADIMSFTIQAAGGAMLANQEHPDTVATGQKIYMVGVGVQMAFVTMFLVVTFCFHRNILVLLRNGKAQNTNRWVKPLIWAIYAVLVLIMASYNTPYEPSSHTNR